MSYSENKDILKYSRIEGEMKTFYYICKIPNFWEVYLLTFPMIINTEQEQPFKFQLETDTDQKYLRVYMIVNECPDANNFKCIYNISITHESNIFSNVCDVQKSGKQILLHTCSIEQLSKERIRDVPNDTLTIYFRCKWYVKVLESTMCTTITYEKLLIDEETIFTENKLVSLNIGDQRLYANKNLMCKKSDVFKAMLNTNMKEGNTNEVDITDMNYDTLKLLLTYIQFDFLPNLNIENVETLSELLIAADKYNIQELKSLCEIQLIKLFKANNFMKFLNISCLENTTYLNKFIQEWFKTEEKDEFNSELAELLKTNSETLLRITKCPKNILLSRSAETRSYNTSISWNMCKTRTETKESSLNTSKADFIQTSQSSKNRFSILQSSNAFGTSQSSNNAFGTSQSSTNAFAFPANTFQN